MTFLLEHPEAVLFGAHAVNAYYSRRVQIFPGGLKSREFARFGELTRGT